MRATPESNERSPRRARGLGLLLLLLVAAGCANPSPNASPSAARNGAPANSAATMPLPEPTVRRVADADSALLWGAMKGYMQKGWGAYLRRVDEEAKTIDTKVLEWTHENVPHRTKLILRLASDPASPKDAQLRLVALRTEAQFEFEQGRDGEPIPVTWVARGKDADIERIVADEILRRYGLLVAGKDPDTEPITSPPAGLRASTEAPAALPMSAPAKR